MDTISKKQNVTVRLSRENRSEGPNSGRSALNFD